VNAANLSNVPAPPITITQHPQIEHIDPDLNQECDGPIGEMDNTQHSDLILGTAVAM
jgi:hypothetical protein